MNLSDKVEESKQIHKETGKTFYFATRLLPEEMRKHTYALYAFFRKADDIVDTTEERTNKAEDLEALRRQAKGEEDTDDPVVDLFNQVRKDKGISDDDIDAFIDSMKMDINKDRYDSFEEVRDYMDGSAAAVGRMMCAIMGTDDVALSHATALGEAYQMSNFLRDIGEDIDKYNRVYLPKTTRDKFGVSVRQISDGIVDEQFKSAVEEELTRTEVLYEEGVKGIKHLPENCQFGVFASAVLYSEHHRLIRENGYDVLTQTPSIRRRTKIKLIALAYWHWRRSDTPLEAFRKSSSIYDRDRLSTRLTSQITNRFSLNKND